MHPILFRIPLPGWDLPGLGPLEAIPIYSYGVMLGLSLVVGWYLTLGLADRDGLPRETMANNYVITAIAAVIMSRVLYILTNLDEFHSLGDVVSMRNGGLVAYGGFIGGWLGSWGYLKWKKIRLMPWADVAVPSLASGLAITRIGCYLFGCDFGRPLAADAPDLLKRLGTFPHWTDGTLPTGEGSPAWVEHVKSRGLDPDAAHSLPVHPTQIYESLVGVALLLLLLWARKRQRFRGQICALFFFAYGAARFLLEILRDDPERGSLPLSMPQHLLIPACLLLFAVGYMASVSRIVAAPAFRRLTQALALSPAVVAYFALKPETFAPAKIVALSTSQFIGVTSAVGFAAMYFVWDQAALTHPEAAMDLGLPEQETGASAATRDVEDTEESGEAESTPRRKVRRDGKSGLEEAATAARGKRRKKKKERRKRDADADTAEEVADEASGDELASENVDEEGDASS